jgi:hypothetical protein
MLMFVVVVQVSVYCVRVVVRALEPVAVQSAVPEALFNFTVACGNIVPKLAVFFIQSAKVRLDPLGITPEAFGTPDWVSNCLISFDPVATPLRFAV